jgi:hypothetical protein
MCLGGEYEGLLTLEGVYDVEGGNSLALGVLSVGDGIADDALEEGLQDTTGLLVDHCDTLGLHWWDGRVKVAYWLRYA